MPESQYTDAQLTKLAETPFTGGRGLAGDLAAEVLELRATLAAIRAADQWTASLPPTDPLMTEADRMACEWSDYRKDYADGLDPNTYRHVHEAFKSGWEAAQGKTFEGGPLR